MPIVTATELARNFRTMLDRVEFKHEQLIVVRNNHEVARIVPGPATMTALDAMSDIYNTMQEETAREWIKDSRKAGKDDLGKVRDPWAS